MADDTLRTVTIERIGFARFRARNVRGGTLDFGEGGDGTDFGALELLLTALAGCSGADVDYITNRRAEPESFSVEARGHKVKDDQGNRMADLELVFRIGFPAGEDGDAARRMLPVAVQQSHDRLCTVSRTIEVSSPVEVAIEDPVPPDVDPG
jgi:putative redox protein